MARFEMAAADIAAMAPAGATGESYYELGLMYAAGRSVPLDLVAAHKWLNVAVAKGFREAAQRRAELAGEMSAAEIATAQREARLWLTRH
jgi:TPR repeat protein